MKPFKMMALLGVLMIALTGCVGKDYSTVTQTIKPDNTVITETTNVNNSDTHSWTQAAIKHSEAEAGRISAMTVSVMAADTCVNCTGEGKAWSDAFKVLVVGYGDNFKTREFNLEKPTSGYDVAKEVVKGVVTVGTAGVYTYGGVELGKALMEGAGDTTSMGDGAVVTDSLNKTSIEAHATAGNGDPINTLDQSVPVEEEPEEELGEEPEEEVILSEVSE